MREVSCRVLEVLLKNAKKRDGGVAVLLHDVPHDLEYLSNPKNRIDWDVWVRLLDNAGTLWSLEELSDLNQAFTRSPMFAYVGVIARLLFTSRDLFDWICKKSVGAGNQLFTCVKPTYEHVGNDTTIIRLEIQEGFRPSPEFFWMTRGSFITLPRLVASGDAHVDLEIDGNVGTFKVRYKVKRGTLSALVRFVTFPFTARRAARELKAANESLQERFYELEDARAKLDRQARRLRIAHAISDVVHGDLDLQRTLAVIARALITEAGFVRSELRVGALAANDGAVSDAAIVQTTDLATGSGTLGTVAVHLRNGADADDARELMTFIAPTLALAIQNALAYRELTDYKAGLEKLVEDRTAQLRGAHDELARLVEQLKEAQASREKFFGNISHEIRTPLSLILLATGDIERRAGAALDQRSREGLTGVSESARKLLRLVDELLLLAAGQVDKLTLNAEPTETVSLLRQIVGAWRPAAEAAELQLNLRAPNSLVLEVDPTALERVVSNLLSNAVKYTPKGGAIDVELAVEESDVRLSIADTGRGIDPDLATRLFGRFERAAGDDRRKAGTGIGLALVKQLVEAHGGTVTAKPRSVGTEFRILLPSALIRTEARAGAPTQLRTTHAPGRISKIRSGQVFTPPGVSAGTIVIAEDEPRLAETIAELLSERYTVIVALDGASALDLVRKHHPQLLVTDVDMPGMTGIELAQRFREETGDRLAPIIILSAMIDLNTRLAGLEAGAVDYVAKPFESRELVARVDAQFRMRDLAIRLHRAEQVSSLGILTSGLAHELRNPANGVVNSLEPLREALPEELTRSGTDVADLFEAISTGADQILALVNQLLGFHGSTALEMRETTVSELVARAVRLAGGALAGIEVREHLAAKGTVMCAPALMVQVLTNLVENAGHAAGRGGWVEIRTTMRENQVSFEVTDSGPGVPVELRERIFEPFFTTKPQGRGTGLGLSVARTVIYRHHGTLEVRQREGRTAFVIELPIDTNSVKTAIAL